jgi:peptide/nickel transport system substrate-binding protein
MRKRGGLGVAVTPVVGVADAFVAISWRPPLTYSSTSAGPRPRRELTLLHPPRRREPHVVRPRTTPGRARQLNAYRVRPAALLALAVSLFACTPPPAHVLRLNDAAIGELDPHKGSDYADAILMYNVYDFLVRPGPGGTIVPDLALSWSISEDGRVYDFQLDDRVFHDGSPVGASDVVFSGRRMVEMNRGFSYLFPSFTAAAPAPDRVVFTLDAPFAPFLDGLIRLAIVDEDAVCANLAEGSFGELGDYGSLYLSATPAGSGPYQVVSHNPRELTVLRPFEEHPAGFAPDAPEIVRFKYSMQTPTVRALLTRGQHELTRLALPVPVLRALSNVEGIELRQDVRSTNHYIKLNTKRAPTDDVHVRRAMALAFDYEALFTILEVIPGLTNGRPARGPLPAGVLGYDPDRPPPRRDLEAARAELALARYDPDEHPIQIQWVSEVGTTEQIALLFQQNMAEIGLDVRVVRAPWGLVLERGTRMETTPHASTVDVSANSRDPDSILTAMYHSSSAGSWAALEWLLDPAIDRLIEDGRRIVDPEARTTWYSALQDSIIVRQPSIFAYETSTVIAKQTHVRAPRLDDPTQAIPAIGANYLFREFSVGVPKR